MPPPLSIILHVDMDAFFAAVEQVDNPSLRGKPVIVGGLTTRGVVSTASYEARKFGVRSAMPTREARRRCRNGVFLRPRIERYTEISREIFEVFHEVTDLVERVSIDEAYIDVSKPAPGPRKARALAKEMKAKIHERVGLTASVGIAPCKFAAKIASDLKKPDGLVVISRDELIPFLAPLPVSKIPGVGKVSEAALRRLGVHTIFDLAQAPLPVLQRQFGKMGPRLYDFARGIDPRPVVVEREAKSLGSENTFEKDQTEIEPVRKALRAHAEEVARRLALKSLAARTVTLKLRYDDFQTITRSHSLDVPVDGADDLYDIAAGLLARTEAPRRAVRLTGLYAAGLVSSAEAHEPDFFGMSFDSVRATG